MMWTREQLKFNAKASLRRFHWYGVAVCLITLVIGGSADFKFTFNFNVNESRSFWDWLGSNVNSSFTAGWLGNLLRNSGLALFAGALAVVLGSLGFLIALLIGNVLNIGEKRFFLVGREQQPQISVLFSPFHYNYGNAVITMFLRSLFTFLWSLLFVIPGIVKSYAYRMVPYLLAENPDMDYHRALSLSQAMMHGHKMDAFVLDLSFLGWQILSAMTSGVVGILYANPYIAATNAELYTAIRAEAFAKRLTGADELRGFAPGF